MFKTHAINDEWQNWLVFDRKPVSGADKDLDSISYE